MERVMADLEAYWQCPNCNELNTSTVSGRESIVECSNCNNKYKVD